MTNQLWARHGVSFSARNANTGCVLAERVGIAATRRARAIGLLLRKTLPQGEGLWIVPSRGVHTCGMRYPIDVIALDGRGRVVDLVPEMKPWRIRLPRKGCLGVLELPSGTIEASRTRLGDAIVFEIAMERESTPIRTVA
jgi:uncharacterized membrane protein (UPF0127 family)